MNKKLLESKKAKMALVGMGIIALLKIGGYYAGIPDEVTDKIVEAVKHIVLGFIGLQGLRDTVEAFKNGDNKIQNRKTKTRME